MGSALSVDLIRCSSLKTKLYSRIDTAAKVKRVVVAQAENEIAFMLQKKDATYLIAYQLLGTLIQEMYTMATMTQADI
jgi:hypothetical protein